MEKFYFIKPDFTLVDLDSNFLDSLKFNGDGYLPVFFLDTNVLWSLPKLSKLAKNNQEKYLFLKNLLKLMSQNGIALTPEIAILEKNFDDNNFAFDFSRISTLVDEFRSNLKNQMAENNLDGEILISNYLENLKNYEYLLLKFYIGCLKIIEITKNSGITELNALANITEFIEWYKGKKISTSAVLLFTAVSIFGGSGLGKELLKVDSKNNYLAIAKNGCFDMLYVQMLLHLNWDNSSSRDKLYLILVTHDSALASIFNYIRLVDINESNGNFQPTLSINFEECKINSKDLDAVKKLIAGVKIPRNKIPESEEIRNNLFAEKDRLVNTLKNNS